MMPTLIQKYQVKVVAVYYTDNDIEDVNKEEAEEMGWQEFYDNSHRAEIESTEIYDQWQDCEDCGADHVEDDHECEAEE